MSAPDKVAKNFYTDVDFSKKSDIIIVYSFKLLQSSSFFSATKVVSYHE